jgi:outer membrane lipoprotein-sorting protein
VHIPQVLQRHRALRWLAPAGVVCVAGLAATGMFKASASSESLPQTTPAALIAAVQQSDVTGFSGTVVSQLSLGLPDLPSIGNVSGGTSFTSLLSGSHTLQVWYGGIDEQRIALLGSTDETDMFRNGNDVWQWSSADKVAVHVQVPALAQHQASAPVPSPGSSASTPADLARSALSALEPSTEVAVEAGQTVADRSAYELVLTPRTTATKIGSVHIAVDGSTKVPLGVQVYARDSSTPAVDVAYTSIRFARQATRNFIFSPPPGAKVRDLKTSGATAGGSAPAAADSSEPTVRTTGSGWTSVLELTPGKSALARLTKGGVLNALTPVSGSWGKGRLLDSALLSVLVTDDGRVFSGAVDPADLYAAARAK